MPMPGITEVKKFLDLVNGRWKRQIRPKAIQFLKFLRIKWKYDVITAVHRAKDSMQSKDSGKSDANRKAGTIVTQSITARIQGTPLHPDIKEFLFNYWSRLLLKIYGRDGAQGPAWESALKVVDDVTKYMSVQKAVGKRQKMGKIYHNLEQRFRNGVRVIAVPEAAKEKFFFRLAAHYEKFPAAPGQPDSIGDNASPFGNELLVDNIPDKD